MPSPSAASRGALTAEWALALPAVILVASVLFAGIGLLLERTRLDQAAADVVRLVGLGVGHGTAVAGAEGVIGAPLTARFGFDDASHTVCVTLTRSHPPTHSEILGGLQPEGRACGLIVDSP